MCGIIGFRGKNVTQEHLRVLQKVMIESRIRGMHASGIAWSNKGSILSVVKPIPIDKLVEEFNWSVFFPDNQNIAPKMSLIAHARYSTSDIRYNQPIVGEHLAIAHNGVITQSDPSTWKKTYGYNCKTCNDSELILRCIEAGNNPISTFKDSSIAGVILNEDGEIMCFRNFARPLWVGKIGESTVMASTRDILERSGVSDVKKFPSMDNHDDLQRRDIELWKN